MGKVLISVLVTETSSSEVLDHCHQERNSSNTLTVGMGRVDFGLLKDLVSQIPWESVFEGIEVRECWSLFKSHF